MSRDQIIISAIDNSPFNRGLSGVDWLADERNVAVVDGTNVMLFSDEGQGAYQAHVLLAVRGRKAQAFVREGFRRIFEDHGASLIFGMVPDFRRDVKMLARWVGMKFAGKRSTAEGLCELFVLPKEIWKGSI